MVRKAFSAPLSENTKGAKRIKDETVKQTRQGGVTCWYLAGKLAKRF